MADPIPTEQPSADPSFAGARTHLRRTGTLRVAAPIDRAFPLFTPVGERLWAPGWDPELHHPVDGTTTAGMAFSTVDEAGRSTHWVVVDWQPERHRVRYVRATPGVRVGTVEVCCREDGAAATRVEVTYELTAVSAAGDEELATWTEGWFADYLGDWERQIAAALAPA